MIRRVGPAAAGFHPEATARNHDQSRVRVTSRQVTAPFVADIVTTGVSLWVGRADPASGVLPAVTSGVSPIPRPQIALTSEAGGPCGPV